MAAKTEISTKNTKEQILSAYHEAVAELESRENKQDLGVSKQKSDAKEVVAKALEDTKCDIFSDIGKLKSKLMKEVDSINQQLVEQCDRLDNLRRAIAIEQKYLEEVYGIKEQAARLSALLLAQDKEKEEFVKWIEGEKQKFTTEMAVEKAEWSKQRLQLETKYKEQKELLEKTRVRDEEEYEYNLKTSRLKEVDDYNYRRTKQEQELMATKDAMVKREEELAGKEHHLRELEDKVASFPSTLEAAVSVAETKVREQLQLEYHHSISLKDQEHEGTRKLYEQRIKSLEEKVAEQDLLIKDLNEKATSAVEQVKSIAYRALETSGQRMLVYPNDSNVKNAVL
ncbi:hypothetical protein EDM53_01210 [Rickettsiales endosymbiont of Peranema trichophorum]|uniref:hypothetical protein n=1 Tax=Rickettsiales endosymbiont of Peranema trichophorum TaxID=2486577 RepID=UPI0010238D8A|nr:hypothetical protein [Rickettsiales endosymbiont of Peranema trichophorum]RZI47578.1 hypothetical protein EDM53_01210 [Rickettsiales endosymbiont of Peranema trichophorum]